MLGDRRQRYAGLRLALHLVAGERAKEEDEEGKSQSDQHRENITVTQWDGSEEGSWKFKGPEQDVKSAETGF